MCSDGALGSIHTSKRGSVHLCLFHNVLTDVVCTLTGLDEGLDSLTGVEFKGAVDAEFGIDLPNTVAGMSHECSARHLPASYNVTYINQRGVTSIKGGGMMCLSLHHGVRLPDGGGAVGEGLARPRGRRGGQAVGPQPRLCPGKAQQKKLQTSDGWHYSSTDERTCNDRGMNHPVPRYLPEFRE
jgi:hypothetical protein